MMSATIVQTRFSSRWLYGLILLLSACTPALKPEPAELLQGPRPGEDISIGVTNVSVVKLWQAAEAAREAQEYTRAGVLLDQAIRMAPEEAALWSRVAEVQLLQKQAVIAENYAFKSNTLAENNPALRYRNWLIIKYAREMRKDLLGAQQAQAELDKIRVLENPG